MCQRPRNGDLGFDFFLAIVHSGSSSPRIAEPVAIIPDPACGCRDRPRAVRRVLLAGLQKVLPPVPGWEVGRRALTDSRWRLVDAGRERKDLGLVDGR